MAILSTLTFFLLLDVVLCPFCIVSCSRLQNNLLQTLILIKIIELGQTLSFQCCYWEFNSRALSLQKHSWRFQSEKSINCHVVVYWLKKSQLTGCSYCGSSWRPDDNRPTTTTTTISPSTTSKLLEIVKESTRLKPVHTCQCIEPLIILEAILLLTSIIITLKKWPNSLPKPSVRTSGPQLR